MFNKPYPISVVVIITAVAVLLLTVALPRLIPLGEQLAKLPAMSIALLMGCAGVITWGLHLSYQAQHFNSISREMRGFILFELFRKGLRRTTAWYHVLSSISITVGSLMGLKMLACLGLTSWLVTTLNAVVIGIFIAYYFLHFLAGWSYETQLGVFKK